jgi:hypothetical protein
MTLGIYWPLLWALNVALPLPLMMAFVVTGAMLCGVGLWLAIRWEGGAKKLGGGSDRTACPPRIYFPSGPR